MLARSVARSTVRWLALGAAAALAGGCATAPTAVFSLLGSPRAEALGYFPATAPQVAVVRTDPDDAQVRRVAAAGLLDPLARAARRAGIEPTQVRSLLGNDLVVGRPHVGAPLLLVLVARDEDRLRTLADARVLARRAAPAGIYRGARLYAGRAGAFAVRGPVLLASRTTADLRGALDTRHGDDGFDPDALRRALPAGAEDAVVRAVVDLRPQIARGGERLRAVPLLTAVEEAGIAVGADGGFATVDVRADLTAGELVELDVPITAGETPPRAAAAAGATALSIRDLAHTLGAARHAAQTVAPLVLQRLEARAAGYRRVTGVDVRRDVVRALHGPATLVLGRDGTLLRAEPSRPEWVLRALDRLARAPRGLPDGLRVRRGSGSYAIRRGPRLVLRVVAAGDAVAAGRAPARVLRALARRPASRPAGAAGGLALAVPASRVASLLRRAGVPLAPRDVSGWLRASTRRLDARLTLPLEP